MSANSVSVPDRQHLSAKSVLVLPLSCLTRGHHGRLLRSVQVAQALTSRPVKGMLTGPVTILNWSFPRLDLSRKEQVRAGRSFIRCVHETPRVQ